MKPFATRLLLTLGTLLTASTDALGFPHVVQPNETLARIAERHYGRIQLERVIATANGLDGASAPPITPGMILELPALSYHRALPGETWESLAQGLLGSPERGIVLAEINGQKPWIQPSLGQIVRIPYNLRFTTRGDESLATLAYRFLGSTKHAYRLAQYNSLEDGKLEAGSILLVPLSDLPLTTEGKRAARDAATRITEQAEGDAFSSQRDAAEEVRAVALEVRGGRYVSAVARASALLALGRLTRPDAAHLHRLLLEAAVALDTAGLARSSCQAHLDLADEPDLDPVMTSPKVLEACKGLVRAAPDASTESLGPAGSGPSPNEALPRDATGRGFERRALPPPRAKPPSRAEAATDDSP